MEKQARHPWAGHGDWLTLLGEVVAAVMSQGDELLNDRLPGFGKRERIWQLTELFKPPETRSHLAR